MRKKDGHCNRRYSSAENVRDDKQYQHRYIGFQKISRNRLPCRVYIGGKPCMISSF